MRETGVSPLPPPNDPVWGGRCTHTARAKGERTFCRSPPPPFLLRWRSESGDSHLHQRLPALGQDPAEGGFFDLPFFCDTGEILMDTPPSGEREGYAGLLPAKIPAVALLPACVREPRERVQHTTGAPRRVCPVPSVFPPSNGAKGSLLWRQNSSS